MSEDQELAIGQQQDAQVRKEMGVYGDRALQQYVSDIGLRLASAAAGAGRRAGRRRRRQYMPLPRLCVGPPPRRPSAVRPYSLSVIAPLARRLAAEAAAPH